MSEKCTFGLEFPEGLFMGNGQQLFFWHKDEDTAYALYASREELMGKYLFKVKSENPNVKEYKVTYEFEGENLLAARLVTSFNRSAGKLVNEATLDAFNEGLANGSITILRSVRAPSILFAAQLTQDELVAFVEHTNEQGLQRDIYIGPKGQMQKQDMKTYLQGGSTFHIMMENGDRISYDRMNSGGLGQQMGVIFNDTPLAPLKGFNSNDVSTLGIMLPPSKTYFDPFTHPKAKAFLPK